MDAKRFRCIPLQNNDNGKPQKYIWASNLAWLAANSFGDLADRILQVYSLLKCSHLKYFYALMSYQRRCVIETAENKWRNLMC